jgi:VCBS repeat-containing protein
MPSRPPVITARNVSVYEDHSIPASSMIASVTDPDHNPITMYAFYDTGTGGGHFISNNQSLAPGHWIYVTPSQLSALKYVAGSTTGRDTIYVEAYDGKSWSNMSSLTASILAPGYAKEDASGATVYYDHQGGSILETHSGGSLSWRNDNPGNILFANQATAIGSYYNPTTKLTYAIFSDYATGVGAAVQLLQGSLYAGAHLTIDQAMARWTGAKGIELQHYEQIVDQSLHLPGSTQVSSLSHVQLETMVTQGIQVAEGWAAGHTLVYGT